MNHASNPIQQAIRALASVCDGANENDGQGFNSTDTTFGKGLSELADSQWTKEELKAAYEMLRKYRGQLLGHGFDFEAFEDPAPSMGAMKVFNTRHRIQEQQREIRWQENNKRLIEARGGLLFLKFPYSAEIVDAVKSSFSYRKFDPESKGWFVADKPEAFRSFVQQWDFEWTEDALCALPNLVIPAAQVKAEPVSVHSGRVIDHEASGFTVRFPYDAAMVSEVKSSFSSRRYDGERKLWVVNDDVMRVHEFAEVHNFEWTEKAEQLVTKEMASRKSALEDSKAHDADVEVSGLGGELRPFQKAAVAYFQNRDRGMIADQQGLGKTIEAMAVLQSKNAFPAIILCPASLKLNWEKEVKKWLPGKTVQVIQGGKANLEKVDVTIMNYDIVKRYLDRIVLRKFKAMVADESHAIKNAKSQRTKAVIEMSKNIQVRLLLTGTPVTNRPVELVTQLECLDLLKNFGNFWSFAERYCEPHNDGWGWQFTGASNTEELHERLRTMGFVRRLKSEVLKELPDKTRNVIPLELTNRAEYNRVEKDIVSWYVSKGKDEEKISEVEQLARIEALKQVCVAGKMKAAIEWITDFLESGEKLVFFAHHVDVQEAIYEAFKDVAVYHRQHGEEAVTRFQNDDSVRLFVASMKASKEGITLTKSSDVAFLELAWTPTDHDQAEDRCHRIGQKDNVTAHYLLANDTIDMEIMHLLDSKRKVVEAVTDGRVTEDMDLLSNLMEKIVKKN